MTHSIYHGGTRNQEPDSVCYVSYWHIPNGCDYDLATAIKVYFSDKEYAEALTKKYEMPPEMAYMMEL